MSRWHIPQHAHTRKKFPVISSYFIYLKVYDPRGRTLSHNVTFLNMKTWALRQWILVAIDRCIALALRNGWSMGESGEKSHKNTWAAEPYYPRDWSQAIAHLETGQQTFSLLSTLGLLEINNYGVRKDNPSLQLVTLAIRSFLLFTVTDGQPKL